LVLSLCDWMEIDSKVDQVVFPGDVVGSVIDLKIRLGPGLMQNQENIVATKSGILRNPQTKYYWIESNQKRYVPAIEDMVIGIVRERYTEGFKVDVGSAFPASLPALSFEGATKKNRPNLQVGSIVYARVILANKDMEPELACISARNKAEGYGELLEGFVFKCSIGLAYRLLEDNCPILKHLGKVVPYEIAVGMNGRVWVNSASRKHTILICNAILNSEFIKPNQILSMVQKLTSNFLQQQE